MRKRLFTLLFTILAAGCFSSCVKELQSLINDPYWLHGDFNPTLGVPLAYGNMNLGELLNLFDKQPSYVTIDSLENGIIRVNYDTVFHNVIHVADDGSITNGKSGAQSGRDGWPHGSRSGAKGAVDTTVYSFHNRMKLNIFDNIHEGLGEGDTLLNRIRLNNVFLGLVCHITADLSPQMQSAIRRNKLQITLKDLKVNGYDKDGNLIPIRNYEDTISLNVLIPDGVNDSDTAIDLVVFDINDKEHSDVADMILNRQPRELEYNATLKLSWPQNNMYSIIQFLADSLEGANFNVDSRLRVEFPFSGAADKLTFPAGLHFKPIGDVDTYGVEADSAALVLVLQNGLPLSLNISGYLVDKDNRNLSIPLFTDAQSGKISGCPVRSVTENGVQYWVADSTKAPEVRHFITLNRERFRFLKHSDSLSLITSFSTSQDGFPAGTGFDGQTVSLRNCDKLKVRMYLMARPQFQFDTIISIR